MYVGRVNTQIVLTGIYFCLLYKAPHLFTYLFDNSLLLLVGVKDFQKGFVYVWLVLKSILKKTLILI